jgi:transposase
MSPTTKVYKGVDISKRRLDVFVRWGEAERKRVSSSTFPTTTRGHRRAPRSARGSTPGAGGVGGHWELRASRRRCFLWPPRASLPCSGQFQASAKLRPRHSGRLAKTDRIDAQSLARFAGAVRPMPRSVPDEEARALGDILSRRHQVVGSSPPREEPAADGDHQSRKEAHRGAYPVARKGA